jgi:hypothetical protein
MKKLATYGLLVTVLVFSLGLFVNDAHARTAPVIKIDELADEIDKLEEEVDKYKDQVNQIGASKDAIINSLKAQVTALTQAVRRTNPYISILSPKVGKVINSKEEMNIKWKGVNLSASTIDIHLAIKDSPAIFIANVPNSGSASVTLPNDLANGSYYLTLTAKSLVIDGKAVSRQVKTPFKIVDKSTQSIAITSLTGQTVVQRGGNVDITFKTTNIPVGTNIGIYLTETLTNSIAGLTPIKIVKSKATPHTVAVVIPSSTTVGDHRLAVAVIGATSTVAYNVNGLTVTPGLPSGTGNGGNTVATSTPTLTLLSPNNTTSVKVGGTILIRGTHIGLTNKDKVKIYLKNASSTETQLGNERNVQVCPSAGGACSNLLTVTGIKQKIPAGTTPGTYKIKVVVTKPDGRIATDETDPFLVTN